VRWVERVALLREMNAEKCVVRNREGKTLPFDECCLINCNPKFGMKHKFNFIRVPKMAYLTYGTDLSRMQNAVLKHFSVY
jgi:hypothetical protein